MSSRSIHFNCLASACLAWLALAGVSQAATPVITGVEPSFMFVDPFPESHSVTITGTDLTLPNTSGFTINQDVQVNVRWLMPQTTAWGPYAIDAWTPYSMKIGLGTVDHEGVLQYQVCVRTVGCSVGYQVWVKPQPTVPPVITQAVIQKKRLDPSVAQNDPDRLVTFNVTNIMEHGQITINGRKVFTDMMYWKGYGYFWMPADLQSVAGAEYDVQLNAATPMPSNVVKLQIWDRPAILLTAPPKIGMGVDAQDFKLWIGFKSRFQVPLGSVNVIGPCSVSLPVSFQKPDVGMINIPAACFGRGGDYRLVLQMTNMAGTESYGLSVSKTVSYRPVSVVPHPIHP